ncbi:MAG: glycosyl transferase family 90, partial [Gammaproteobacteria bacterium]|nr:glycosyl transferase family 90 [Gammaproteobacteria bacterium]
FSSAGFNASCGSYKRDSSWAYHLDFKPLIDLFPTAYKFQYLFGDNVHIPDSPTFLKSRPIAEDYANANAVLLKLNSVRHYFIPRDHTSFQNKKPLAVWRGIINREHRRQFVENCFTKSNCDIGNVGKSAEYAHWKKSFMSISEQLKHRFVLSVEGKDVATNLKWILASNSLCMMTKPKYETWFMEGRLIPNVHYVELNTDYSDLEEKMAYYNTRPEEALKIIRSANAFVQQFQNPQREFLISLLVLDKYFSLSGQTSLLINEPCQLSNI